MAPGGRPGAPRRLGRRAVVLTAGIVGKVAEAMTGYPLNDVCSDDRAAWLASARLAIHAVAAAVDNDSHGRPGARIRREVAAELRAAAGP